MVARRRRRRSLSPLSRFRLGCTLAQLDVMGRRMYEKKICQRLVCLLSSPKIGVDAPTHEDA